MSNQAKRLWTAEELEEAERLFEAGESVKNVSEKLGRSRSSMYMAIYRYCLLPGRHGFSRKIWTEDELSMMTTMVKLGASSKAIAEHFDTNIEDVRAALRENNITYRGWTRDEVIQVRDLRDSGMSCSEIGKLLNRTTQEIYYANNYKVPKLYMKGEWDDK